MKKHILFYCFFLLSTTLSFGQDFDDYQLLKSTGTIPADFLTPSSEKYKKELENIDEGAQKSEQKDEKQFYLESNFLIDDLLQSAKVLFNDPITEYINKVADELLKDNKELRQQLRFYAVRSSAVNAFATNQGIIFVNVGLLAQLESEAQLAFILAHEISHVKHGHPLDMFLESQKINRYTKRAELMRNTSFDDRIVAKNYFSKELEKHADKEGLEIYLESNYSLDDLDGVFDVLQYSYLPFDIVPVKKEAFETEFLKLPEEYFLGEDDLNGIDGEYEEDESKSTHPSIESRREACATIVADNNKSGLKSFIVEDEKTFLNIRDIARFELAYYYLHAFRYQDAVYACYILQQKYPNSKYLKKIRAKALYGYAKFKNEMKGVKPYSVSYRDDNIYLENMKKSAHEDIEGPSQQIYYFLSELKTNELTVYALRYVWDVTQEYPKDKELKNMREDLFLELSYHYEKRSEFSSKSIEQVESERNQKDSLNQGSSNSSKTTSKKLSKYDKIKKTKKEQETITEEEIEPLDFAKYAFRDIIKNSKFKKLFEAGQKEKNDRQARADYYSSAEGRAELRKRRKKNAVALDIDSVLCFTPYYIKILDGNTPKVDYLRSEEKQNKVIDIIQKNAKLAKVHITMLDPTKIDASDSESFNDLRILSEWISQQNRFGGSLLMEGFEQDNIDKLAKKYGTRYLLFTGMVVMQRYRTNWIYWSVIYDMHTGRYEVIKEDYFRQKDSRTLMNAHVFDTFLQIKFKSKQ